MKLYKQGFVFVTALILFVFAEPVSNRFSQTVSKFLTVYDLTDEKGKSKNEYIWAGRVKKPFSELILSWNALRPKKGKFDFYISIHHRVWSKWRKISEWGVKSQQTFVNTRHSIVHVKHVRTELQRGARSKSFKIKVVARNGATIKNLKALFVCLSDFKSFSLSKFNTSNKRVYVKSVPRQSQMVVGHSRFKDLCSPTSTSMILNYFNKKHLKSFIGGLSSYVSEFADKVHDDSYLDIYGNWTLNVAQAFDSSQGRVFFRVERLNGFDELYKYLKKSIPVAVSIRGKLRGGVKPYDNGHFVVVIGWSPKYKTVICLDPAFSSSRKTITAYRLDDFIKAWGKSRNLSYVAIPRKLKKP